MTAPDWPHADLTRRCSTCPAPVLWAYTEKGSRTPFNAQPSEAGTFVLERHTEGGHEVLRSHTEQLFDEPGPRYVSHFATCPQADKHRRPRGPR